MLMSSTFKTMAKQEGDLVLDRKGLATDFVVPEAVKGSILLDANVEERKIIMSEGESVYILADKFGLADNYDEVDSNIFFVNGGVVLELVEGKILLEGSNGEVFEVDETGDIDYPEGNKRIEWVTSDGMYARACMVMKHRYSTTAEITPSYVDNLVINVTMSYQSQGNMEPVLSIRYATQFEDLGLGVFQFIDYKDTDVFGEDDDDSDTSDLVDVDDEEEEEEEDNFDYDMEGDDEDEEDVVKEDEEDYEDSF